MFDYPNGTYGNQRTSNNVVTSVNNFHLGANVIVPVATEGARGWRCNCIYTHTDAAAAACAYIMNTKRPLTQYTWIYDTLLYSMSECITVYTYGKAYSCLLDMESQLSSFARIAWNPASKKQPLH